MTVGIPRSLFYYYYGDIWKDFFDYLKINYITSPPTNKSIMEKGEQLSTDEMCLSLKNYLGHIDYLKDKCDLILVPRISNFNSNNQMCTNFWAAYDIVQNLFDINILHYNIDLLNKQTTKKAFYKIGHDLKKDKILVYKAYRYSIKKQKKRIKTNHQINLNKLNSKKTKILIVSHPYNLYDELIGKDIIKFLSKNNIELVCSDNFDYTITNNLSKKISKELYFKPSKSLLGSITLAQDKVDGIIFISAFPCALDSLANELAFRKIKKPYLNIVIDTETSFTGLETRLESFVDVLKGVR